MNTLKADALLLLTALIWGTAFVAQRVGMDSIGPISYNAARFLLGSLVLLPLLVRSNRDKHESADKKKRGVYGGILAGAVLFMGASLQQSGLVYTTAGKAGFITGLYVIIVPFLGLFLRQKNSPGIWIGALLAVWGMYFLSVTEAFTIGKGDLLVMIGACFWAIHVLVLGRLAPEVNPIRLAFVQFLTCALLSWIGALIMEEITWKAIEGAALPILYGGIMSVGVAYTLQVLAQQYAPPAHAAIILSFEAVFAVIAGIFLLDESMDNRGLMGCALMLSGMLLSQLWPYITKKKGHSTISTF